MNLPHTRTFNALTPHSDEHKWGDKRVHSPLRSHSVLNKCGIILGTVIKQTLLKHLSMSRRLKEGFYHHVIGPLNIGSLILNHNTI